MASSPNKGKPNGAARSPTAAEGRNVGGDDLATAYHALVDSYGPDSRQAAAPAPGTPAPAPAPGGKEQLLAAYDRLVEYEATRPRDYRPAGPAAWRRFVQPAIIVACLAAIGYLWFGRPAWLYPRFEPIPARTTEAGVRQQLIAASIVVSGFQGRVGRLPTTVEELGIPLPGMSYLTTPDGGFRLVSPSGDGSLILRVGPDRVSSIESGRAAR